MLAVISVLTVGLEVCALARLGEWAAGIPTRSTWRKLAGIGWPMLLAALLGVVVAGLQAMFGFRHAELFMWIPDVVGWLLLLIVLNLALGLARAWLTIRRRAVRQFARTSPPAAA